MSIDSRVEQHDKVFGEWKIEKQIGSGSEGGKSVVYKLKRSEISFEEECAMKAVNVVEEYGKFSEVPNEYKKAYYSYNRKKCSTAENEVRLMYSLRGCANIVTYLDYKFEPWQEEKSYGTDLFIRMELLDNLGTEIGRGIHLDEKEIIKAGIDICNALIDCHSLKIIHRDIKPDNIFINSRGNYMLGDFGISKIIENSSFTSTTTGTMAYAAPEQFVGGADKNYDERVDIYSLGLTLYELANGNRLPFAASQYAQMSDVEKRIKGEKILMPSDVSSKLGEILLKACEYEPESRFQTAKEFKSALAELLAEEKINTIEELNESKGRNLFEDVSLIRNVASKKTEQNKNSNVNIINEYDVNKDNSAKDEKELYDKSETEKFKEDKFEEGYAYYKQGRYKKAIRAFMSAADNGNADAQYYLGLCFRFGKGVTANLKEEVKWIKKAAEGGNLKAETLLGQWYYKGYENYIEKDRVKAVEWLKKAADSGFTEAEDNLGICYFYGTGVEKDINAAVELFEKAASKGLAGAQINLGKCYDQGLGVKVNHEKAFELYKKAAEQGNLKAQYKTGWCYESGRGTEKNVNKAIEWYEKAARQGNEYAKFALEIVNEE